jgi:hypothetical protein
VDEAPYPVVSSKMAFDLAAGYGENPKALRKFGSTLA